MLTDISLGQYYPGNSFIHKLDPRTKILSSLVYIIAVFWLRSLYLMQLLSGSFLL